MIEAPSRASKAIAHLEKIARGIDTADVIVKAALLEDLLEQAILSQMRELSNTFYKHLFSGNGPLATFSAKIDIAFAFQIIDQQTATDFNAIRHIRNEFAHAKSLNHFKKQELVPLFQKLRGYKEGADVRKLFDEQVSGLTGVLSEHIETSIFTAAMGDDAEP